MIYMYIVTVSSSMYRFFLVWKHVCCVKNELVLNLYLYKHKKTPVCLKWCIAWHSIFRHILNAYQTGRSFLYIHVILLKSIGLVLHFFNWWQYMYMTINVLFDHTILSNYQHMIFFIIAIYKITKFAIKTIVLI